MIIYMANPIVADPNSKNEAWKRLLQELNDGTGADDFAVARLDIMFPTGEDATGERSDKQIRIESEDMPRAVADLEKRMRR